MKPEVTASLPASSAERRSPLPGLSFSLPPSKFRPPAARPGVVTRTALVDRLAAAQVPFITVVAPPGYGKTTLLAQWAERLGPRVAWVSCDDGDNDPVVLFSALAAALDRIEPVDPTIFWALASSGAGITVVPRLVSAIAAMQPPVTLVLDHAEAVTNKQCLNTHHRARPAPPAGLAARAGLAQQRAAAHGPAARPGRDRGDHRRRPGHGPGRRRPRCWRARASSRRGGHPRTAAADRGMAGRAVSRGAGHEGRHPARARSASRSPATTASWATTCAPSCSTGSRPRRRRSSPGPRCWTGCADRSATRSWAQKGSAARARAAGGQEPAGGAARPAPRVVPLPPPAPGAAAGGTAAARARPGSGSALPGGGLVRGERDAGGGDRARPGGRGLRPGGPPGPGAASSRSGPAGASRRCCAGWSGSGI